MPDMQNTGLHQKNDYLSLHCLPNILSMMRLQALPWWFVTYITGLGISYSLHHIIDIFPRISKWKKYKIKTSFDGPDGPKAQANKTGILIFIENCL